MCLRAWVHNRAKTESSLDAHPSLPTETPLFSILRRFPAIRHNKRGDMTGNRDMAAGIAYSPAHKLTSEQAIGSRGKKKGECDAPAESA